MQLSTVARRAAGAWRRDVQAKVYDILGLVSRNGVEGTKRNDPGYLIRSIEPDYVVGCDRPAYLPMSFIADPQFRSSYKMVYIRDDHRVWRRSDVN